MTEVSIERVGDPLPKRFLEVSEKRKLLDAGIVLKPDGFRTLEFYDIANACQTLVVEKISAKLIDTWKSPDLPKKLPFFQDFSVTYYSAILEAEGVIWRELVQDVVSNAELNLNQLSPHEAAILTLAHMPGFENFAASSQELFVELALHAEVYENLLREQLGNDFSWERYYDLLLQKMPLLMKRLIAMDSILIDYYRANVIDRTHVASPEEAEYYKSPLQNMFFLLNDNFEMRPKPALIDLFREVAKEDGAVEDNLGRQENRGCPFLRTENKNALIEFAIRELIKQHQKYIATDVS